MWVVGAPLPWPAEWRVFPRLLTSVNGEIHERQAVVHRLYTAVVRPVGFEDAVTVSDVAHEVHQPDLAPFEEHLGALIELTSAGGCCAPLAREPLSPTQAAELARVFKTMGELRQASGVLAADTQPSEPVSV